MARIIIKHFSGLTPGNKKREATKPPKFSKQPCTANVLRIRSAKVQ